MCEFDRRIYFCDDRVGRQSKGDLFIEIPPCNGFLVEYQKRLFIDVRSERQSYCVDQIINIGRVADTVASTHEHSFTMHHASGNAANPVIPRTKDNPRSERHHLNLAATSGPVKVALRNHFGVIVRNWLPIT